MATVPKTGSKGQPRVSSGLANLAAPCNMEVIPRWDGTMVTGTYGVFIVEIISKIRQGMGTVRLLAPNGEHMVFGGSF